MSLADVSSSRFVGLALALLAGLLVSLVLLRLGRGRFPPRLFGIALAVGALSSILPMRLENLVDPTLIGPITFGGAAFKALLVAGLIEEGAKLALGYYFVRPHYLTRSPRDTALGLAAVALGFALIENIAYVTNAAGEMASTALLRAAMSVPGHVFTGLVLGLAVARTEGYVGFARFWRLMAIGLIPADVLHGLYDFPLFLAERAPPYVQPVADLAERLGIAAPTLIETFSSLTIALECLAAAWVIRALNALPLGDDRSYKVPGVKPRALSDALFAPATGWRVGGFVMIGCAAFVALGLYAIFVGALVGPALNTARFGFCSALLAWALVAKPRDAAGGAPAFAVVLRREWPLAAAATVLAAVFLVTGNAPRNALLAMTLRDSGFARVLSGDVERGRANLDAALALAPDDKGALLMRASVLLDRREYDRALADANRLVALDGRDADALALRGQVQEDRHDYQAEEADLDRALSLRPKNVHLLTRRAAARRYRGEPDQGDLDAAMRADPSSAEPHVMRIEFAFSDGDLDTVAQDLDAVSKLDPDAFVFMRGRLQFHRGDFAGAIATLRNVSAAEGLYPALWRFLAAARSGQDGRPALAAAVAKAKDAHWPLPLAQALLGQKTLDEASSAARALDDMCEADYYGGELWLARGDRAQAIASLRHAATQCPVDFVEYSGARIELRNLGVDPSGA